MNRYNGSSAAQSVSAFIEKKKRKNRLRSMALLLILCVCILSGCDKGSDRSVSGVEDKIAGFLLTFDHRQETQDMVRDKKQGKIPVRVTWYYEKGGTAGETEEEIAENSSSSDDPELISDVYYALGNTIVLGNSLDQRMTYQHYFIALELEDGREVRYNFVSENTIRLGDQNYVVETDGSLWRILEESGK